MDLGKKSMKNSILRKAPFSFLKHIAKEFKLGRKTFKRGQKQPPFYKQLLFKIQQDDWHLDQKSVDMNRSVASEKYSGCGPPAP